MNKTFLIFKITLWNFVSCLENQNHGLFFTLISITDSMDSFIQTHYTTGFIIIIIFSTRTSEAVGGHWHSGERLNPPIRSGVDSLQQFWCCNGGPLIIDAVSLAFPLSTLSSCARHGSTHDGLGETIMTRDMSKQTNKLEPAYTTK